MKSKFCTFTFLFVFGLGGLFAQEPDVSFRFTALTTDGSSLTTNFLIADKPQELQINSNFRSLPMEYKGQPRVEFFQEEPGEDGKIVRKIQAAGDLPRELFGKPVLLLLNKRASKDATAEQEDSPMYELSFVDDDPAKFGGGSYYFFNQSQAVIGLKLGDRVEQLAPGEKKIVRPSGSGESEIEVKLVRGEGGEWHWVRSYSTMLKSDRRFLVFLTDSGNTRRPIRFHSVADYLSKER